MIRYTSASQVKLVPVGKSPQRSRLGKVPASVIALLLGLGACSARRSPPAASALGFASPMTNNDFLRSFRYALELDPGTLQAFFAEGGAQLPRWRVAAMLKDEGEDGFEPLSDDLLSRFLDGVITAYRGPRPPSEPAQKPEEPRTVSNNRVLRALRIAFELRDSDVQELMQAAGREVSKAELGALFRREGHRNYQPCGDQFTRAFLRGLGLKRRQRPMP